MGHRKSDCGTWNGLAQEDRKTNVHHMNSTNIMYVDGVGFIDITLVRDTESSGDSN